MADALSPLSNVTSDPVRAAGVFVAGSVLLFGGVYFLSIRLGLPAWVFQSAAVVLITGLPIVMLTSHLDQRSAGGGRGWLTWRRTTSLGATTFAALAIAAAAYMGAGAIREARPGVKWVATPGHDANLIRQFSQGLLRKYFGQISVPDHKMRYCLKSLRQKPGSAKRVSFKEREKHIVRRRPIGWANRRLSIESSTTLPINRTE